MAKKQNDYNYKKAARQRMDLKPVDEVKALFRQYFSRNATTGHVMDKKEVVDNILKYLDAKEDAVFAQARDELQREGFIRILSDGLSIELTQKGASSF